MTSAIFFLKKLTLMQNALMLKPSQPNVADLNQGEMVVRAPASVLGVRLH